MADTFLLKAVDLTTTSATQIYKVPITDDTAACEVIGQSVKLIECNQPNPKATTPDDLPFIESLIAAEAAGET